MLLSFDIFILISNYSNKNLKILNKKIYDKIIIAERSLYWKTKYFNLISWLGMSNIGLDLTDSRYIPKQEYYRLLKESHHIKYLIFYSCQDHIPSEKTIPIVQLSKDIEIIIKFVRPYCQFNTSNIVFPKEFDKLVIVKLIDNHPDAANCQQCFLQIMAFHFPTYMFDYDLKID